MLMHKSHHTNLHTRHTTPKKYIAVKHKAHYYPEHFGDVRFKVKHPGQSSNANLFTLYQHPRQSTRLAINDERKDVHMPSVPKKVYERLVAGIKQFQPVLASAKSRDVNEADTVTIIKNMLGDVFGYDKYSEVTSEFSIRGKNILLCPGLFDAIPYR